MGVKILHAKLLVQNAKYEINKFIKKKSKHKNPYTHTLTDTRTTQHTNKNAHFKRTVIEGEGGKWRRREKRKNVRSSR